MKQLFPPNAQLAHASVIAYFRHWLLNCLMDQNILHEVPKLITGSKYVIRTELMYK
jgi:hypothetical protein